jgi:hypothetical protein
MKELEILPQEVHLHQEGLCLQPTLHMVILLHLLSTSLPIHDLIHLHLPILMMK